MKQKNKIFWKLFAVDYAALYPHPASFMLGTTTRKLRKILGVKKIYPTFFDSIEEGPEKHKMKFCLVEKEYVKHAKIILNKLEKTPRFFEKINQESRNTVKKTRDYALWLFKQNLSKYSDKKLIDIYSKLFNFFVDMNIWGTVVNLVDFSHNMLTEKIIGFLEKRIEENDYKLSVPKVFGILTTPVEKSPIQKQEEDFYKLLSQIQRGKKSVDKAAAKLKKEYDWLEFHYSGPKILEKQYFAELLISEMKQEIKGEEKLKELRNKKKKLALNQNKISNELGLSNKELYWINIAKTFMFLKALRKDIIFQASRLSDLLIREIGKRLELTPDQVRYITTEEVKKSLAGNKINVSLINKRMKHSAWIFDDEKIKIFTGREAKEYSKRIIEEKVEEKIKEFRGTPACVGKVKGAAKLIFNADDMAKMNKGDILVSPATNPNLLSAMKKAGAIVTDEGGITCHAAIISRELNIPCIIGTKIATKVLRDGDEVEVDAEKGVVRILEKK